MIRQLFAALFLVAMSLPALAQVPPYTYPLTLGTSSVTILPANPARKKVIFHNPNNTAMVAVCPIGPTRVAQGSLALIVAAINGAGCMTLLPYDRIDLNNGAAASNPPMSMGSAWVGVASAPGSALTVWEWE